MSTDFKTFENALCIKAHLEGIAKITDLIVKDRDALAEKVRKLEDEVFQFENQDLPDHKYKARFACEDAIESLQAIQRLLVHIVGHPSVDDTLDVYNARNML